MYIHIYVYVYIHTYIHTNIYISIHVQPRLGLALFMQLIYTTLCKMPGNRLTGRYSGHEWESFKINLTSTWLLTYLKHVCKAWYVLGK
jgi:hypothetical protein